MSDERQPSDWDVTGVDGKQYIRALAYALSACPSSDANPRMAHLAFIGDKIIGADGTKWHVGILPPEAEIENPVAVTRSSAEELMLGLDYAYRVSQRRRALFTVHYEGERVVVVYGERVKDRIEHDLQIANLGTLPRDWKPPVPAAAPPFSVSQVHLGCGKMIEAMKWYRSWEKDHGTFVFHGDGGMAPFRVDITCGGDLVCQAYLLPDDHPPAELPPDDPLFAGRIVEARSQSILDLEIRTSTAVTTNGETKANVRRRKKKRSSEDDGAPDLEVGDDDEDGTTLQ